MCYNLKRELSNLEVNTYGVKVKRGIERYLELPEGYPAELLKGEIVMVPSPSRYHQEVALEIVSAIYKVVKEKDLGKVFYEFDVHLDDKNVVRPDIVFISKERESMIKDHWVEGAPDLIVEIVSSASKTRDFIVKRELYEKSGVKEYWIVDPETKEIVLLENESGHFKLKCYGKECKSSVLKDFSWGFK
ncbi:MAG: Uma2 family endonuclease [Thermotogaceae bacterium]|nr:Uma2 family endonuclease [Thermotogaceae bacterium]